MIIRDKDQEVLEVEMFHKVYVGKVNAELNFERYLTELRQEFQREHTKHLFQMPINPANSHIIIP